MRDEVGFIGLGAMGLPMAVNLIAAGIKGRDEMDWSALALGVLDEAGIK